MINHRMVFPLLPLGSQQLQLPLLPRHTPFRLRRALPAPGQNPNPSGRERNLLRWRFRNGRQLRHGARFPIGDVRVAGGESGCGGAGGCVAEVGESGGEAEGDGDGVDGEGRGWGFVNEVVGDGYDGGGGGEGREEGEGRYKGVVEKAVEVAETICGNSPDGVVVSKYGIETGWEGMGVEEATEKVLREGWAGMEGGENMREGLKAFVERRKPRWRDSKL